MSKPLLSALVLLVALAPATAQKGGRSIGGHLAVDVGGTLLPVVKCSGGDAVAEVTTQGQGGQSPRKAPVGTHFEPLLIEADLEPFLPWVQDLAANRGKRLDFAVLRLDFDYKVATRLQVTGALLTKAEITEFDAGNAKAPIRVRLTLQPERTAEDPKTGEQVNGSSLTAKRKNAQTSNFRVTLGGVALPQCVRLGPIRLGSKAAPAGVGVGRDVIRKQAGTPVECDDVTLSVSEVGAEPIVNWHRQSVIEGKLEERALMIEVLAPDLKEVLFRFEAKSTGILAARRDFPEAGAERLARREAVLYVNSWSFDK